MEKKLILYGAGNYGERTVDILEFHTIPIECFCDIDPKKRGLTHKGYVIKSIEEIKNEYAKGEYQLFVTLRYPDYVTVRDDLIRHGIFESDEFYYDRLDMLIERNSSDIRNYFDDSFNLNIDGYSDRSFIRLDEKGLVCAFVPIELVFTETTESSQSKHKHITDEWIEYQSVYENIPIMKLKPHIELFTYFAHGTTLPDSYFEWYNKIFTTRGLTPDINATQILEKRSSQYVFMQNGLINNYFPNHPPKAVYNQNGYFNLTDGHHRIVFLFIKGFNKVALCMTKRDYLNWRNDNALSPVLSIIEKTSRNDYYTPIHNPFFINTPAYRETTSKSRLHHIVSFFMEERMRNRKVIDIGANLGYFGNHFCREGAEVICLEPDTHHHSLACSLKDLIRSGCVFRQEHFEYFEYNGVFDIGIMLTVFYHYYNNIETRDKFIDNINRYIKSYLVWESGENYDEEREFLLSHTKFKKFHHLAYTYGTNKIRQLGVFSCR